MVSTVDKGYNGPTFCRSSYSSVNFGDEFDYNKKCGKFRDKCNGFIKGPFMRITLLTLKLVILINLILFVIFPLIFKFSYTLQRKIVFLNFGSITLKVAAVINNFNLPKNDNYSDPKVFGLEGARNFQLDNNGVKLGVWHVLPQTLKSNGTNLEFFETSLMNGGHDVILYNHGNAGSRATGHRVELYQFLSEFFHVITYDYRGYGDSSDEHPPSEPDVISDSTFMVNWIRSKISPESQLFIWGHSLGTSITLGCVSGLKQKGFIPSGVILEAPFNNFREEISEFPLSMIFKHLPWFQNCIVEPLTENGFLFQSDKYILNVDCPILILHAEDDKTVPFALGKKLYETASSHRLETQGTVTFERFPRKFHYGHKYIIRAPELHDIVENFIESSVNETKLLNKLRNPSV